MELLKIVTEKMAILILLTKAGFFCHGQQERKTPVHTKFRQVHPMQQNIQTDTALERSALIVATLTSFMGPFMISSVNVALPAIQADLQMDAVQLSWIATAYLLAVAVGLVPAGKIADIHGRKKVFATGLGVYTLGAGLAVLANSAAVLIGLRVIQGLGAAMFVTTGMAIITSIFPPTNAAGSSAFMSPRFISVCRWDHLSAAFSPIISAGAVSFLIMLPLGLFSLLLTLHYLKGEWLGEPGQKLDVAGCLLYASAILAMVYGATRLPSILGTMLLLSGLILFAIFIRHQLTARFPVFDVQLFVGNKTFAYSSLAALLNYSATFAVTFLLSLYLQYLKGMSPQTAGSVLMAQPIVMAMLSPMAGRLSDRIEPRLLATARNDHHGDRRLTFCNAAARHETVSDCRQPDPAWHRFCPVQLTQYERHHGGCGKTILRSGIRNGCNHAPARPDVQHGYGNRCPLADRRPPGYRPGKL